MTAIEMDRTGGAWAISCRVLAVLRGGMLGQGVGHGMALHQLNRAVRRDNGRSWR